MFKSENKAVMEDIYSFLRLNQKKLFLLTFAFSLFLFYKNIFVIAAFFLLDFIISYVDQKYHVDLMFDMNPLGLIIFSYALDYRYGLFFALMMPLPRIILGKLERRHLLKMPILMALAFLADGFNFMPIAILGSALFVLRYVLEYAFDFALTGTISHRRFLRRVGHLIGAYLFFTALGVTLISFLRN
jgi:hypothetical protein